MTPRTATTNDDLTAAQRRALDKAVKAHAKLNAHQAKEEDLVKERDEAIRAALAADVTQRLVAKTLDLSTGMVWKIKEGVSTKQLETRQRGSRKR